MKLTVNGIFLSSSCRKPVWCCFICAGNTVQHVQVKCVALFASRGASMQTRESPTNPKKAIAAENITLFQ